jgi:hypothetical protein
MMQEEMYEIAAEQGWSDSALGDLALDFLIEGRYMESFLEYLRETQEEENEI